MLVSNQAIHVIKDRPTIWCNFQKSYSVFWMSLWLWVIYAVKSKFMRSSKWASISTSPPVVESYVAVPNARREILFWTRLLFNKAIRFPLSWIF